MSKIIHPLNLQNVKYSSLKEKKHKVNKRLFAKCWQEGRSLSEFINSLPHLLAGREFRDVVERITEAVVKKRFVLLGMGAHPIKVGLNPILIDLMKRGILRGLALNGACLIHDVELALVGHTSEEVDEELSNGTFGMVKETQEIINNTICEGVRQGLGIGEAMGKKILHGKFPYKELSLLAQAEKIGIPVTVHVAIGTDITHMGPLADGSALGEGSLRDFHKFSALVSKLEKGVFINLGSAVIIPEVFLKALAMVRNLGYCVSNITTINMDFIQHYRPSVNIVRRPNLKGGKGFHLIGHHEIMFPLLSASVIERLKDKRRI